MFIEKVKETIRKYRLIDKGNKVLVGVSGGPDSVALLYALHSLNKELGFGLHIAHLDHMLRKDSSKDRQFVENLAVKLKLPISAIAIDIRSQVQKGSLEETARNIRLKFLFDTAKEIKAQKIALGHNLDDQAETVLMRIIRGTGLYGLSAILPKRDIMGHCVIRPLIKTERKAVEVFLKKRKIAPRIDKTNIEDIYFRNKIRNRLLPLLKTYNSNIKVALSNLAESASFDYDYLISAGAANEKKLGTKIDIDKFLKLHPAMQRLVLRLNISRLKGDMRRLTYRHIQEILDLIFNRPSNSVVDLPKDISVIKKNKSFFFYRR